MTNINELAAEIARNGDRWVDLARVLNISPQAMSRKKKGEVDFSREEISTIKTKYSLTPDTIDRIFFTM